MTDPRNVEFMYKTIILNIIKSMESSNTIKEGEWFCAVRLVDDYDGW